MSEWRTKTFFLKIKQNNCTWCWETSQVHNFVIKKVLNFLLSDAITHTLLRQVIFCSNGKKCLLGKHTYKRIYYDKIQNYSNEFNIFLNAPFKWVNVLSGRWKRSSSTNKMKLNWNVLRFKMYAVIFGRRLHIKKKLLNLF